MQWFGLIGRVLPEDEANENFNTLSMNSSVNRSEPRQGEPCQPRDPFDESDQVSPSNIV